MSAATSSDAPAMNGAGAASAGSAGSGTDTDTRDVVARLAELDEKLHVENKIKDGAENLLMVFDTTPSDNQANLRKQVEEALSNANANIARIGKDIEMLRAMPSTPRRKGDRPSPGKGGALGNAGIGAVGTGAGGRRKLHPAHARALSVHAEQDDAKTSLSLFASLLSTLRSLSSSTLPEPAALGAKRVETLGALTAVLKRSLRVRYEGNLEELVAGALPCLSDAAGTTVRAAAYRLLRHAVVDSFAVERLQSRGLDFYLIKTLSRDAPAQIEKEQAIYLLRTVVDLALPSGGGLLLSVRLLRALIAVAEYADEPLRFVALETLAEIALLDMPLLVRAQGLRFLLSALSGASPDLAPFAPVLAASFCFVIDRPATRAFLSPGRDLEVALSGFTDVVQTGPGLGGGGKYGGGRAERLRSAGKIVGTLLKNWSGLLYLCSNHRAAIASLVEALKVPAQDLREVLLDMFFDVLNIKTPGWYLAYLEGRRQTMYSRSTGQRKAPSAAAADAKDGRPQEKISVVDHFTALLLVVLLDVGLIEALTGIVEEKNEVLTRKATLLIGEILRIANRVLPLDHAARLQTLPRLFSLAAEYGGVDARLAACSALAAIDNFNRNRNRLAPAPPKESRKRSNSLEDPIRRGQRQVEQVKMRIGMQIDDKSFQAMLMDTQVLYTKDHMKWNFDALMELLEGPLLNPKRLEEAIRGSKFARRLLSFFHPLGLRFSGIKKTKPNMRWVRLGCQVVTTFVASAEGRRYLAEDKLLKQIADCFAQLDPLHNTQQNVAEPIFSRYRLEDSLTAGYFEMLGTLSKFPDGIEMMERFKIFTFFYRLSELRSREDLIKAIIQKIDYSHPGHPRIVLSKALTSSYKHVRLYATQHLGQLIQSSPSTNEWALELLLTQLYDPSLDVCELAVHFLEEACESMDILELVVGMMPSLDHLGETGHPLMLRFLSTSVGFRYLRQADYIDREMEDWFHDRNAHYVVQIEVYLSKVLGLDGDADDEDMLVFDGTVPPHFYGELSKTAEGCEILREKGHFAEFADFIRRHGLESADMELVGKLKSVLWAVGTIGSTPLGLPFLEEEDIVRHIVDIAEQSLVLSVRGTCFFVLGLIASTPAGIEILDDYGWDASVTSLGQPIGLCIPRDLDKFLSVPAWDPPCMDGPSVVSLQAPSSQVERDVIIALSNLSNQLLANAASRTLVRLKSRHRRVFSSIPLFYRALHLLESCHYRLPVRRHILDLFDVRLDEDTVAALSEAEAELRAQANDLPPASAPAASVSGSPELTRKRDEPSAVDAEVGGLLKRARRKAGLAEGEGAGLLDSDEESDVSSDGAASAAALKAERLEPMKKVVGGF